MSEKRTAGGKSRLEIENVEKSFHTADGTDLPVLGGLNFDVEDRTFTCLIGPSGCGKTTLLRLVLGLDRDFTGGIRHFGGRDHIAAIFQEPRLLPWRTVEQNVRLALPDAQSDKDLDVLFTNLGICDKRHSYPGELSLGLARRVALARAYAVEPELIVLDEPFVSLDAEAATRLRRLLTSVWQSRPTTILMVTHNVREAVELSDKLIFLTSRPAKLRGVYPITQPRSERDAMFLDATLKDIQTRFPGTVDGECRSNQARNCL